MPTNQHQLLIALHSWGADNDGKLPPHSGHGGRVPAHGVRGTGDFFDVLVPEYVQPPEVWYCPGGALFPDSEWANGRRGAKMGISAV